MATTTIAANTTLCTANTRIYVQTLYPRLQKWLISRIYTRKITPQKIRSMISTSNKETRVYAWNNYLQRIGMLAFLNKKRGM